MQSEHPLVGFGDTTFTEHWIVTPNGTVPLEGAQIVVTDYTRVVRVTPTWAVIVAIVGLFFIFVFSLFFLLAKEDRVTGYYQITITAGGFTHQTVEPVVGYPGAQLHELQNRANYARWLVSRVSSAA